MFFKAIRYTTSIHWLVFNNIYVLQKGKMVTNHLQHLPQSGMNVVIKTIVREASHGQSNHTGGVTMVLKNYTATLVRPFSNKKCDDF